MRRITFTPAGVENFNTKSFTLHRGLKIFYGIFIVLAQLKITDHNLRLERNTISDCGGWQPSLTTWAANFTLIWNRFVSSLVTQCTILYVHRYSYASSWKQQEYSFFMLQNFDQLKLRFHKVKLILIILFFFLRDFWNKL